MLFTDTKQARRILQGILVFLCAAVAVDALWQLLSLLWFEMQPIHHGWDGLMYTAVGRGIVNGLVPYRDLFEFKPPGIFLVSAASLWLFDDIRLGNILQGLCYIGVFLLILSPFLRIRLRHLPLSHWCTGLGGIAFAVLLIRYMGERAGHFQTESFGAVFTLGFLVATFFLRKSNYRTTLGAALLLALAIGMKETFVAITLAGSLMILPLREIPKKFLLPLLCALALGTIVLLMLGYLEPYLSIYLPEMMHGRASFNPFPLWVLAFLGEQILQDLWSFSPYLVLSALLCTLLCLCGMADVWKNRAKQIALLLFVSISTALYVTWEGVLAAAASRQRSFDQILLPTDPLYLQTVLGVTGYAITVWIFLHLFLKKEDAQQVFVCTLQYAAALILCIISILAGGMLQQQFGALIPLLALPWIVCTQLLLTKRLPRAAQSALFLALALAVIGVWNTPRPDYAQMLYERQEAEAHMRISAEQIDQLMTACGYERYVIFGQPNVPYGFTKHSPYGPAFARTSFTFPVKWRAPPIPYLQETYREHLRSADFVIAKRIHVDGNWQIDATDIPDDVWKEYADHFSAEPPPCAAPFVAYDDLAFRFRKF